MIAFKKINVKYDLNIQKQTYVNCGKGRKFACLIFFLSSQGMFLPYLPPAPPVSQLPLPAPVNHFQIYLQSKTLPPLASSKFTIPSDKFC